MILERIVAAKRMEIASRREMMPLAQIQESLTMLPPARDFRGAISHLPCAIIAEVKRSSPSKGRIREQFDPVQIAALYEEHGAQAISVLTDEQFFEGKGEYLAAIKKAVALPLLRKDFIIDSYQLYETRVLGGDAVLLIAAILSEGQLQEYIELAGHLGLTPLIEIHTKAELDKALAAGAEVIGINNRNLQTFATDLATTLTLVPSIPSDKIVVTESGINTRGDMERLLDAGVHCFLIGEALMRAADIGEKLDELFGRERSS
jgi:indole-3-glycerol phosphate synthase